MAQRKACCLVSEMLEETGFDRRKARALKRQVLEGLILLCRWQLERMPPQIEVTTRRVRQSYALALQGHGPALGREPAAS